MSSENRENIEIEVVKLDHAYDWTEDEFAHGLQFIFVSEGTVDIIKAVQYALLPDRFLSKNVHNLGFGDFDIENDKLIDSVISNNGDVYRVFNTVLNTIVAFFEKYPYDIVMARGSDSGPEFIEECRKTCKKECVVGCKKSNRRIQTYRAYVNRNYNRLSPVFEFRGGMHVEGTIMVEPYEIGKNYDAVFVFRKIPIALTDGS